MTPWRSRGLFLAPVLLAAALRLPDLAARPMHADEAVHADKLGTLLEGGGYLYAPAEFHGPTLYYLTLPSAWLQGARRYVDIDEVTLRAVPYRLGIAGQRSLPLPAIAVGNLSVGGTGKTPLTAWIAAECRAAGRRPGILLRGYGRDEVMLHRHLVPEAIVVANADRAAGAALGRAALRELAACQRSPVQSHTRGTACRWRVSSLACSSRSAATRWYHVSRSRPWRDSTARTTAGAPLSTRYETSATARIAATAPACRIHPWMSAERPMSTEIVPGPASLGMPRGVSEMSTLAPPSSRWAAVRRSVSVRARQPLRQTSTPAASTSAGRLIEKKLRIQVPAKYETIMIPVMKQTARRKRQIGHQS